MKIVNRPGKEPLKFPDDMSWDEIEQMMRVSDNVSQSASAPQPSQVPPTQASSLVAAQPDVPRGAAAAPQQPSKASELANTFGSLLKQSPTFPTSDFSRGLGQGGLNQLEALKELFLKATNQGAKIPALQQASKAENTQFDKTIGQGFGGSTGRFIGENVLGLIPGPTAVTKIPEGMKIIKLLAGLGENVAKGAAQGAATYDPNSSIAEKATIGGIANPLIGGLAKIPDLALQAIPKAFRAQITGNKLKQALDAVKKYGKPLVGKDILKLSRFEDFPQSTQTVLKNAASALDEHSNNVFDMFARGTDKDELASSVYDGLKNAHSDAKSAVQEAYDKVNDEIEKRQLPIKFRPWQNAGKSVLADIEDTRRLSPKMAASLSNVEDWASEAAGKKGTTISDSSTTGSLKELKNKLFEEAEDATGSSESKHFTTLRKGMEDTIKQTAAQHPAVKRLLEQADSLYKRVMVPFKHPSIEPFVTGSKNLDESSVIRNLVKSGKAERPGDIRALAKVLPDEQKDHLVAQVFNGARDADGNLNPKKLANIIKTMSPTFKDSFIGRLDQKELENYVKMVDENPSTIDYLTGKKKSIFSPKILTTAPHLVGHVINSPKALERLANLQSGKLKSGGVAASDPVRNAFVRLLTNANAGINSEDTNGS